MKRMLLLFFILLGPLICLSQSIILQNIKTPGETSRGAIKGAVLGENMIGPRKVLFLGEQMVLQKEEVGKNSFGLSASKVDKLPTFYSGKIFSPGIIEPFVFENKTPEELILLEIIFYPTILEQPYTLYIDLTVLTSTKPISAPESDDAGEYTARLSITLTEI